MSHSNDESSDDDYGPKPTEATDAGPAPPHRNKRARTLKYEHVYIDRLPTSEYYEHSYMHREIVTGIAISKVHEFIITCSADGHVKFWKKMTSTIEFVKHYQAHLGPINSLVVSHDGNNLVTTSNDKMVKFFEIAGFDLSNMISVPFTPSVAIWLAGPHTVCDRVAVADANSGKIRIYKSAGSSQALSEFEIHSHPVRYDA
jgi:peptidylprolyl isomerase domain and WD repeat-containing protein 1